MAAAGVVEGHALVSDPLVSSSWHRLAPLRPTLAAGLKVVRQEVRGQVWHILVEPQSGRQVRLNASAYALVAAFDGHETVDAIWQRRLAQEREGAPTQDEVLRLLAQLFRGGMVRFDAAPHLSLVFARRADDDRQRRNAFLNPLVLRMPLFDPTRWLRPLSPLADALFRPAVFVAWLLAVLLALLAAGTSFNELQSHASRLLAAPSSYLIAWCCYPVVKLLHELGHGLAVRRYGGDVREFGVSLMLLTPAPYVDASAASTFPLARQRLLVSAAGILVEIALAVVALAVWFAVAPGLVRDVALVVVLVCSISTILFNGNPLLRLDGYHVLCDALQLPNLALRSQAWWSRRWRNLVGSERRGAAQLLAPGERKWLVAYAPASALYRLGLYLTLVFWIGRQSWLLGLLAGLALAGWVVYLLWRWARGSAAGEHDSAWRKRSTRAAVALIAVAAIVLFVLPAPQYVIARGIVWPPDDAQVRAGAAGFVERVAVAQGSLSRPGETLVVLSDPALVSARERIAAERAGLLSQQYGALLTEPVRASGIAQDLERNEAELARVDEQLGQLEIRAQSPGEVIWARPQDLPGSFLKRGAMLGHLLAPGPGHVRVALLEEEFLRTRGHVRAVEIRLADTPWQSYAGQLAATSPGATTELPAAALGDRFGGPIPVDPADASGTKARVPVFPLDVAVPQLRPTAIGGRAWVKLVLPPRPLGLQWLAQLRQLLIKQFNPTGQA
jgi:putative peptide zinc metalloprotease protein